MMRKVLVLSPKAGLLLQIKENNYILRTKI